MRLRKLWLANFYNLRDVAIEFDNARPLYGPMSLRFFVGLNGSGKSNALEAVGLIFSHLAADLSPGFEFDIEYELRGNIVRITNQPGRLGGALKARPVAPVDAALLVRPRDAKKWAAEHVRTEWATSGDAVIPGRVVGYSTGPNSGLQWALSRSIEKIVRNTLGEFEGEPRPAGISESEWQENRQAKRDALRRRYEAYLDNPDTLFLGSDDALSAVLPLLAHEGFEDPAELRTYLDRRQSILERVGLDLTEPLPSFSLRIAGDWQRKLTPPRAKLLKALLSQATLTRAIVPDPASDGALSELSPDFYAVFDVDEQFRRQTLPREAMMPTPLSLFEELLAWRRQGALQALNLILKKANAEDLLAVNALSDGEFLYLGRYSLLLMLRDVGDCLILLDEPETHFNDQWKVEIVRDINRLLAHDRRPRTSQFKNEVIICTHSDLTLTDADPRQVYVFTEELAEDGGPSRIVVRKPRFSTFAANLQEVSNGLFEKSASIGAYSRNQVESALERGSEKAIRQLLKTVGPGFYRFRLREKLSQLREDAAATSQGDDNASAS